MTNYKNDSENREFEQQILEAENRIAKSISSLFDLEEILHDICCQIKSDLNFDFVGISLVLLAQNTIEAVYGVGIAEEWANRARHYLEDDPDLRDIQADIVKTARTEIIAGWDSRFDQWIYDTFKHNKVNRIYTPILLMRDGGGQVLEDWFKTFDWNKNFTRNQDINREDHVVIDINVPPEISSCKAIGTIEAGYQNRNKPITYETAVELSKLAAKHALTIRKTRLRCVLELIAENTKQILQADLVTLHFLLDSHRDCYIYKVRSGTINNLVPETFPPRLNEQGIGWQSIQDGHPKFVKSSDIESFNPFAFNEGSRSYAAFPLLINRSKQKVIYQTTTSTSSFQEEDFEPVVGVLYVHYKYEHEFTEDEINRGKFLAERAVDAILHAMTYQQVRDTARQLTSLHSVTQSISQIPENAELLSHIAWNTLNVLAADVVTIYAYLQTEEKFVTPPAIAGRLKEAQAMQEGLHEGEIPYILIQAEEAIYASNICQHDYFKDSTFAKREGIRSVVGVLLKIDEDIVGVMFINYRRQHTFSKQEKQIIKTLASSAASAIKNQRWLQTLSNIDHEIITTLEPEKLLSLIVKRAVQITGADLGVIRRLDLISQCLVAQAKYPADEPVNQDWQSVKIGEGISGAVALSRKPDLVENVNERTQYIPYFFNTLSEISVPLGKDSGEGGVIGVLSVESRRKVFTQRDLQKLEVLADLAVIAIQNADSKKKLANMEMMAALGELTSQLLHRMKPDIGALKVLLKEATDSLIKNNTEYVMLKINDMRRKIDSVSRNLGRMKNWKQEEPQSVKICHVIADALEQVHISSEVSLQKVLPDDLPEVFGGEQQLVDVFDNLIQNAIDAMPGGGDLSISASKVERDTQTWVEIIIIDTGLGIAKENQKRIFQLGFTTKSTQGNMGFGLWWTEAQLLSLGGKLSIESNTDEGTQVTVVLPAYVS